MSRAVRAEEHWWAGLRRPVQRIVTGLAVFVAICALAVLGYVLTGATASDALYMVIITIFGVGYGEIVPIDTWAERGLTMALIVAGYAAVIYAVGGFIQFLVDGELRQVLGARRMTRDIDQLTDHVVVAGLGRMGTQLVAELRNAGVPFVVIDTEEPQELPDDVLLVRGDATEESVLRRAGIERATTLAAVLSHDATNVYVVLTARGMRPDLRIIARGEERRVEAKLRTCGADEVVMPTSIGATRMGQLITRPSTDELLDRLVATDAVGDDLARLGVHVHDVPVGRGDGVVGRPLSEVRVHGAHGALVVAVRHADGAASVDPDDELALRAGDTVVLLSTGDAEPRLHLDADAARQGLRYRGVAR